MLCREELGWGLRGCHPHTCQTPGTSNLHCRGHGQRPSSSAMPQFPSLSRWASRCCIQLWQQALTLTQLLFFIY